MWKWEENGALTYIRTRHAVVVSLPKSKNKLSYNCFESKSFFLSSYFVLISHSFRSMWTHKRTHARTVCNRNENELCVRNAYRVCFFFSWSNSLNLWFQFNAHSEYVCVFWSLFLHQFDTVQHSKRNLCASVGLPVLYWIKWNGRASKVLNMLIMFCKRHATTK